MSKILDLIKENNIKWIDLRFTDTKGKEQHVSVAAEEVNNNFLETGKISRLLHVVQILWI